jgi:hypothetical protein
VKRKCQADGSRVAGSSRQTFLLGTLRAQFAKAILPASSFYCPVPESEAICGLFVAVSVRVNVAMRLPFAIGVKVTFAEQFAPEARLVQSSVCAKSPLSVPVICTLLKVTVAFSKFVTEIVFTGLVVPTLTVPKSNDAGLRLTAANPDPLRLIVCGLFVALSATFTVAVCAPFVVGAKVTVIVHVPPAATLVPQVFTWVYAEDPIIVMLMLVSATL